MTLSRIHTGKRGEDLALSFLKREKYEVIEKNYKTKYGEIDIIGKDNGCIAFVEVRSQNSEEFGLPEDSINKRKQTRLAKMAISYIKRFGLENEDCRFDVVCIEDVDSEYPQIRLIKNAFELDLRYR